MVCLNSLVVIPLHQTFSSAYILVSDFSFWFQTCLHCFSFCTVVTYYGTQNERAMLRYELRAGLCPDVILSTYTIFERESNKPDRAFMNSLQFEYLVLDEAHCIKNAQSSRFTNLNMLKTKHRLLLSGTPVQNDISELLSMLSFLMPQVQRVLCYLFPFLFGHPLILANTHLCILFSLQDLFFNCSYMSFLVLFLCNRCLAERTASC